MDRLRATARDALADGDAEGVRDLVHGLLGLVDRLSRDNARLAARLAQLMRGR